MWRKWATCCGIDLFYHLFYRQQKNPRIARELWWTLVVLFSLKNPLDFSRGLAKIVRTRRVLRVREEEEVDLRFWCPERFLPRHLVRGCPKAWYLEKQKEVEDFQKHCPITSSMSSGGIYLEDRIVCIYLYIYKYLIIYIYLYIYICLYIYMITYNYIQ